MTATPFAPAPLRVLVAEDSPLIRSWLVRMLGDAGCDVVGEAASGPELLTLVATTRPDVVLTDVRMPPTGTDEGIAAALRIRAEHPGVAVLVLSQGVEAGHALRLLQGEARAVGYLLKDRVDGPGLLAAVQRVARGGSAIDPSIVELLLHRSRHDDPVGSLTAREREVLERMAQGLSNAGVAAALDLSERTVERHIGTIFAKLGLASDLDEHRRVLAVLTYLGAR